MLPSKGWPVTAQSDRIRILTSSNLEDFYLAIPMKFFHRTINLLGKQHIDREIGDS